MWTQKLLLFRVWRISRSFRLCGVLATTLQANKAWDSLCLSKLTVPKEPLPSKHISSKSWILGFSLFTWRTAILWTTVDVVGTLLRLFNSFEVVAVAAAVITVILSLGFGLTTVILGRIFEAVMVCGCSSLAVSKIFLYFLVSLVGDYDTGFIFGTKPPVAFKYGKNTSLFFSLINTLSLCS